MREADRGGIQKFNKRGGVGGGGYLILKSDISEIANHGLLIEYGPICHIVKLPISMIRPIHISLCILN